MEKEKISGIQLFALMFLFEMGTAVIVSYGTTAKKDTWLAILFAMCGGIILFFIYYFLYRQYPKMILTKYIREIFGKYLGWGIGLLYVMYFLYIAARVLRDFGALLASSVLTQTPLLVINMLLILTICYVISLGVEVLARTAEVLIVILIFFGIVGSFFVLISAHPDIRNVRPFLENGWKPILTTAFPLLVAFPFGEMLAFTMLLPYLNRSELVKKVWLSALISSGIVLAYTTTLEIMVLRVAFVERSTFPLLAMIGRVSLLNFIERLDSIAVFTLLITVFFKISILFYSATIGLVDLFHLKRHQQIVFPVGGIILFSSMTIASNFAEHIEEGFTTTLYYLHVPFLMVIPLFMLIVSLIRNRFKKAKDKKIKMESSST